MCRMLWLLHQRQSLQRKMPLRYTPGGPGSRHRGVYVCSKDTGILMGVGQHFPQGRTMGEVVLRTQEKLLADGMLI